MCKKLIFLISFVFVLAVTGTASAYELGTAVAVWNYNTADVAGDDNGPPFSDHVYYYGAAVDVTGTGIDGAEDFDGWAAPSAFDSWTDFTPPYELVPTGAVSLLVRTKLGDLDAGGDGFIALTGLYEGTCATYVPSYAIEIQDGEPFFAVCAAGDTVRTQVGLGQAIAVDTWYDILGVFDPDADELRLTVLETASGTEVGSATVAVAFDSLIAYGVSEMAVFCSPCHALGAGEGDGLIELEAVWDQVVALVVDPYIVAEGQPQGDVCKDAVTELVWDDPCAAEALQFDVWFASEPNVVVASNSVAIPIALDWDTEYVWRVDTIDELGEVHAGKKFSFYTGGLASEPTPEDRDSWVPVDVNLSWEGDGCQAKFRLIFADNPALTDPCVNILTTETTYMTLPVLDAFTLYYWRVDECDAMDTALATGEVWSFTTGDPTSDKWNDCLVRYEFEDGLKDMYPPYYDGIAVDALGQPSTVEVGGGVLTLDGTNFVEIPFPDGKNPFDGSTPWTIIMGVKMEQFNILCTSSRPDIEEGYVTGDFSFYTWDAVYYGNCALPYADVCFDNAYVAWFGTGCVELCDNKWHTMGTTYRRTDDPCDEPNDGLHRIYYDFAEYQDWGSDPAVWTYSIAEPDLEVVLIGGTYNSDVYAMGSLDYVGDIAFVYIFTRELSPEEVFSLMKLPNEVSNPNPAHGEEGVLCTVEEVCFQPPEKAIVMNPTADPNFQGPLDFYVYFGPNDPCDMVFITEINDVDTNDVMCVDVGTTIPGLTYYWRVDFNDQNAPGNPVYYECTTFKFTKWGYITDPYPEDEAADQSLMVMLVWENDGFAESYEVYFGTDESAVAGADNTDVTGIYRGTRTLGKNFYSPQEAPTAELALGTTYYWRIDEVGTFLGSPFTVKGHVLSFEIGYWLLVDDFESYTSTTKLRAVWEDWHSVEITDDPTNAASVARAYTPEPNFGNPPLYQAMEYVYEWPYASEPKHCTVRQEFKKAQDWSTMGVKALVLHFYGDANDGEADPCFADGMSVTLGDDFGKEYTVEYRGDAEDLYAKEWILWPLALKEFEEGNNVNAAEITKMEIKIIGGTFGHIYFDEFRLYVPTCFEGWAPDITRDCIWNEEDLAVMQADWLVGDTYVQSVAVSDANLMVEYLFDPCAAYDDVGNPWDSSGNAYHGIGINDVNIHGGVLTLNNLSVYDTNDYNAVEIPLGAANPFDGSRDFSIAMEFRTSIDSILISSSKEDPNDPNTCDNEMDIYLAEIEQPDEVIYDSAYIDWMGAGTLLNDGQWHLMVTTYDAETTVHHIYADGLPETWNAGGEWDPNIPNIALDTVRIGTSYCPDTFAMGTDHFIGDIDEVRIYDRVLSRGEIVNLLGYAPGEWFHAPVDSDADLYEDEPEGQRLVNFKDYTILADKWLESQLFGE